MCKSCRHTKSIPIPAGFAGVTLPRVCDADNVGGEKKDCPIDPYVIIHSKSTFVDQQTLKLQEAPEAVPVGELPRHMLLSADRHVTNKAIPGARVTITGIFSTFENKQSVISPNSGKKCRYSKHIHQNRRYAS